MRSAARSARGPLLGLLLAALSGCAHHVYAPSMLPAEFQAQRVTNPHSIDLSRLVNYTVSSERIERGDVLEIDIATGYGDTGSDIFTARVGEDGAADIPLMGRVMVAGLELPAAEHVIAGAAVERGVFRHPQVTVTMKQQRMHNVTVVGAVTTPGVFELPRGRSTLLAAIVAAGGLSEEAGAEVEIRRPEKTGAGPQMAGVQAQQASYTPGAAAPPAQAVSRRVDLVQAAQEGHGGYELDDGDVVMVLKRVPRPIQVIGLVNHPGQYEYPPDQELRVIDAMALAGGRRTEWADKVLVVREIPGKPEPVVVELSIREAKRDGASNMRLAPGDTVSVEPTLGTALYDALGFIRFGIGSTVPLF